MENNLWGARDYPTRVISGQDILEFQGGNQVLIGKTIDYCTELENLLNEAIAKAEGYHEELVNAGLRERPKTPEESQAEKDKQTYELFQTLISAVKNISDDNKILANEIAELKKGGAIHESDKSSFGNACEDKPASSGKSKAGNGKIQQ